jgi:pimeloyl-ACP methyl ester carboxylesterase
MAATVVLVHGAWHGAWCWERVVALLDDAAVPSYALDLPGHGSCPQPLSDLAGDAATLRVALDGLDDAVICGHSYGGAVVSEGAAGHPAARHLVFISGFPLAVGESPMNTVLEEVAPEDRRTELAAAFASQPDGTITLDADVAMPALYADCAADDAAKAIARLGPQSWAELRGVATRAAWETTPSTYAVCTKDRAVTLALQRALARRCTRTVEWPTGHSPFLSRPELVADLLIELAA